MKTTPIKSRNPLVTLAAGVVALAALAFVAPAAAWEPTKPVELLVPAGRGGGADQMARLIADIVAKNKLMKEPISVINKSAGAGAESFMEIKTAKGDPHKIVVTLSNLFTTPIAIGVPFNWKDMTPVSMMALDQLGWGRCRLHHAARYFHAPRRVQRPGGFLCGFA